MTCHHAWAKPYRREADIIRICARCALVWITHDDGKEHWLEYYVEDRLVASGKVPPPCGEVSP